MPDVIYKSESESITKKCPYCAEEIKADAIKCRYCQSDLTAKEKNTPASEPKKSSGCGIPILIIFGLALIYFILQGILGAIDLRDSYSTEASNSSISTTYRITRETGFYPSLYAENYSETLISGTKIKPADNAKELSCFTVDLEGIGITSCIIEVVKTGKSGWVLKNAIGN